MATEFVEVVVTHSCGHRRVNRVNRKYRKQIARSLTEIECNSCTLLERAGQAVDEVETDADRGQGMEAVVRWLFDVAVNGSDEEYDSIRSTFDSLQVNKVHPFFRMLWDALERAREQRSQPRGAA